MIFAKDVVFPTHKAVTQSWRYLPIDVPMCHALDCRINSDIETSDQIRLIMEHYVAANNTLNEEEIH